MWLKPSFMSPNWSTPIELSQFSTDHDYWAKRALTDVQADPLGYRNSPLCPDHRAASHFFLGIRAHSLWQVQWPLFLPVAMMPEYPGSWTFSSSRLWLGSLMEALLHWAFLSWTSKSVKPKNRYMGRKDNFSVLFGVNVRKVTPASQSLHSRAPYSN